MDQEANSGVPSPLKHNYETTAPSPLRMKMIIRFWMAWGIFLFASGYMLFASTVLVTNKTKDERSMGPIFAIYGIAEFLVGVAILVIAVAAQKGKRWALPGLRTFSSLGASGAFLFTLLAVYKLIVSAKAQSPAVGFWVQSGMLSIGLTFAFYLCRQAIKKELSQWRPTPRE